MATKTPASLRSLLELAQQGDARVADDRMAEDAAIDYADPTLTRTLMDRQFNRGRDAGLGMGPTGMNRQWAPFFEAVQGAKVKGGPTFGPPSPGPGLPAGYTEDRYGDELDRFVAGGQAPMFASSDQSGFPAVGDRFAKEVNSRQRQAASIAALARQGGR